jgi:cytochrome c553
MIDMKKKMHLIVVAGLLCGIGMLSCSKSNETTVANPGGGGGGSTCDTVNMKYATNILPIIQANCYSCHGNGNVSGGVSLDSYDKLKTQANNGTLVAVITHAAGVPAMPQGAAQLSTCDINKIKDWINRGTLNN